MPYFYYPQNETSVAQERKQDNKRGCSKGTSGNGNATGLQFSITAIGSMVMQSANNGLGSTYVSAFTAAMKIKQFTMCPFDAIATSASVFCSQNLGAGQSDRIKKGLRCGITVGVGYGIAAGILLIFAGRYTFYAVCWKECGGSSGCLCQIPQMYGIFLLESWYSQCRPYGNSRTWIFRQSRFLRRNENESPEQLSCLGFVGTFGFTASASQTRLPGSQQPAYIFSDMPVVHPKVYKKCLHL